MKKIFIISLFSIISFAIFAEYRVYQYYVKNKVKNLTEIPPTLVTSALDPKSYVSYHGGKDSIEVYLLRSWQCMGDTSRDQFCTVSKGEEYQEGLKK